LVKVVHVNARYYVQELSCDNLVIAIRRNHFALSDNVEDTLCDSLSIDIEDAFDPRPNNESIESKLSEIREQLKDSRVWTVAHVGESGTSLKTKLTYSEAEDLVVNSVESGTYVILLDLSN